MSDPVHNNNLNNIDDIRMAKALQRREQASATVGRNTNADFMNFKNTFLENLSMLREKLFSVYTVTSMNLDELYSTTSTMFSEMQFKVDAILYLNAIYSSEYYIAEHCLRVGLLANIFANWLDLDVEWIKDATIAGFLHDIGMLEVPKDVIEKEGGLTPEEFTAIKSHVGGGMLMLVNRGIKENILDAIRSHHERYDGSGYPKGKKGDSIGYLSALISIVDVYDSMTSNRPYRLATCPFDVIDFFEKRMIDKFNPGLLYVFLENIPYIYKNALVNLSNDEMARVVFINKNNKTSPIVQLERDGQLIDLCARKDLKIASLL